MPISPVTKKPAIIIPGSDPPVLFDPTIESSLIPTDELRRERVDELRRAAKYAAYLKAREAYPTARLVCRMATPQDFEQTNNEWGDTTGSSADAWEDHLVASKVIDDGKFLAIYGCRYFSFQAPASLAISALLFSVGGAKVAQWDLYPIIMAYNVGAGTAAGEKAFLKPPAGITESPIIVSEKITLDMDQWVATASTAFVLSLDAYVVELEGLTLKP